MEQPRAPARHPVEMSEEDRYFWQSWSRLSTDEKEALLEAARILGDRKDGKPQIHSFRTLVHAQDRILRALTGFESFGIVGNFLIKAAAVLGAIGAITLFMTQRGG